VKLQGFDAAGRAVGLGEPDRRWYAAGVHEVRFDGTGLPSGIYLVRLTAEEFTVVEEVVLLK